MKTIRKSILVVFLLLLSAHLFADWPQEGKKINFLLSEISRLDAVFVRNDSDHTPEEAVSHLRMKLERARKSWFAPAREKWTVEMFIDRIASKSSLSGKPYLIRFKDGKTVLAREWLVERLNEWSP